MVDLKCKCTNCRFNTNSNCKAGNISVDSTTICKSYIEKRMDNVEFADEINQPLVRKSTDVECNANCIFSKNHVCIANGITVGDSTNNAICESFLPE